jgi:hypothetical protein
VRKPFSGIVEQERLQEARKTSASRPKLRAHKKMNELRPDIRAHIPQYWAYYYSSCNGGSYEPISNCSYPPRRFFPLLRRTHHHCALLSSSGLSNGGHQNTRALLVPCRRVPVAGEGSRGTPPPPTLLNHILPPTPRGPKSSTWRPLLTVPGPLAPPTPRPSVSSLS